MSADIDRPLARYSYLRILRYCTCIRTYIVQVFQYFKQTIHIYSYGYKPTYSTYSTDALTAG